MSEEFDFYSEEALKELVNRFQKVLKTNSTLFFDIDELSAIIDNYFESGDLDLLAKSIKYALNQYPGNYEFLLKKAQYYALADQPEKGLELLDELGNIGDSDFYMTKGSILSQLQQYREAIDEFTHALNQNHDLTEVYSNIAFEYENLEQYDKALEYLFKVLDIEPDSEQTLSEIGLCFEMANRSQDAVDFYLKFVEENPYSKGAWFNLAIAYNSTGNNEKAIDAYEFVLAIDEEYASAWFNIANIHFSLGNYDQAIFYYQETIKREDPDTVSFYFLAEAYEQKEMLEEALKNYKKSVEINVTFIEAFLGLARTYFKLGDLESAYEQIAKSTLIEESMPLIWNLRSLRLQEQGYGQLAKYLIKQLIKNYSEEPLYYVNLAQLSVFEDDYSQALDAIVIGMDKAKLDSQKALLYFFKGLYNLLEGNREDGLRDFEFAILLDKSEFNNPILQSELQNVEIEELSLLIKKHNLNIELE
ncbi:MAG: tetratricopeptide repeat protein [Bacteroidales bacterium]|nr:tetratricopeptide repeat protein [Bacteroidales bacterium]